MIEAPATWTSRAISLTAVVVIALAFKLWSKWQYRESVNDTRAELLYQSANSRWLDKWRSRVKAEHANP